MQKESLIWTQGLPTWLDWQATLSWGFFMYLRGLVKKSLKGLKAEVFFCGRWETKNSQRHLRTYAMATSQIQRKEQREKEKRGAGWWWWSSGSREIARRAGKSEQLGNKEGLCFVGCLFEFIENWKPLLELWGRRRGYKSNSFSWQKGIHFTSFLRNA